MLGHSFNVAIPLDYIASGIGIQWWWHSVRESNLLLQCVCDEAHRCVCEKTLGGAGRGVDHGGGMGCSGKVYGIDRAGGKIAGGYRKARVAPEKKE